MRGKTKMGCTEDLFKNECHFMRWYFAANRGEKRANTGSI